MAWSRKHLRLARNVLVLILLFLFMGALSSLLPWFVTTMAILISTLISDKTTVAGQFRPPTATAPADPTCSKHNWSAANAMWTLISIIVTYVLQPRGSHAFLEGSRLWRLSPLFTLFESLWIVLWIVEGVMCGRSVRASCAALLTIRITMARSYDDFDGFARPQNPYEKAFVNSLLQTRYGRRIGLLLRMGIHTNEEVNFEAAAAATAATVPIDEQLRMIELDIQNAKNSMDPFFQEDYQEAIHSEKDFAIKAVVYGLMILQLCKLCSVTGAAFIRTIGFVYIFSWAVVEFVSVYSTIPLQSSYLEELDAKYLWSRNIPEHVSIWVSETTFPESGRLAMNTSLALLRLTLVSAVFIHGNFTFYLLLNGFVKMCSNRQWLDFWDWVNTDFGLYPLCLAVTGCLLLMFTLPVLIVFPIWLPWLQKQTMRLWNRIVPEDFKNVKWEQQERSVAIALKLLIPSWLAFWHFASIIFALLGFDYWMFWDVRYRCWKTTTPWYYEWLG